MCKFLSCVSDGNGNIKYFDVKDIVEQMAIGNPKTYNWNSHTSICQFHGISSKAEDLWNKWEYDPKTQVLTPDSRPVGVKDDSDIIKPLLVKYFDGKNVDFLVNLYGNNSGNRNSGDRNSGYGNSGYGNSGNGNSGNWNSGNRNSGNRNSGDWNSGNGVLNSFCAERKYMLFDKLCTEKEYQKLGELSWSWFELTRWVNDTDMTDQEKHDNKYWDVRGGYLKTFTYKEAWSKCPKEFIDKVKKLKGFNKKKFEQITGLKV